MCLKIAESSAAIMTDILFQFSKTTGRRGGNAMLFYALSQEKKHRVLSPDFCFVIMSVAWLVLYINKEVIHRGNITCRMASKMVHY